MSASLVGSEMCIRDSSRSCRASWLPGGHLRALALRCIHASYGGAGKGSSERRGRGRGQAYGLLPPGG
eukprot:10740074-Alexandrium_andersonii.AAC.1